MGNKRNKRQLCCKQINKTVSISEWHKFLYGESQRILKKKKKTKKESPRTNKSSNFTGYKTTHKNQPHCYILKMHM